MKKVDFSEMSQLEIDALSKDEYKSISPFDKKTCYDCSFLKSAMSWWCTNDDAKKRRGTSLPGCIKCPLWKPDWNNIDQKYKTEENGYIKSTIYTPIKKSNNWFKRLFKFLQL